MEPRFGGKGTSRCFEEKTLKTEFRSLFLSFDLEFHTLHGELTEISLVDCFNINNYKHR
jgi:hypothetical protein